MTGSVAMRQCHSLLFGLILSSFAIAADNDTANRSESFVIPDWFKASFLDLSEDNLEAQDAGKHLMVLFTQDFCPYCEALINKNLTQQSIRDSLKTNFDIVQLNMWGDREVFDIHGNPTTEKQIAADLDVQFTPTLIFFDRDGEPALRTNGYLSSSDMQASLDFVASQAYRTTSIINFLKDQPRISARQQFNQQPFLHQSFDHYQAGQPIALIFEQTDCHDCDRLHECVLSKRSFTRHANSFYTVQLDLWSQRPIDLPDGRSLSINALAQELNVTYTPTIILMDSHQTEVIRAEAQLRSFHVESLFDYVSSTTYLKEPQFQRFIDARADKHRAEGRHVSILGDDPNCNSL